MNVEDLARLTQEQFAALHETMASKADIAGLGAELKSVIVSARDSIQEDVKTFLYPHLRSLDTVLVDVEHLKQRVDKLETQLASTETRPAK